MAQKVITLVVKTDDITGEEIPEGHGETFRYAWEGWEWEIDLNDGNAADIRTMMGNLTSASRKVGRHRPTIQPSRHKAIATPAKPAANKTPELTTGELTPYQQQMRDRELLREIRIWAQSNGFPDQRLNGQLKSGVREAWDEANPERPAPKPQSWKG